MKCTILHESRGRIRVHLACRAMSLREADVLEYYLRAVPGVVDVKVFDRTQDAVVSYQDCRAAVVQALAAFSFQRAEAMELVPEHTSRALNREFEDKLVFTVCRRMFNRLFLAGSGVATAITLFRSVKYIREGLKALWHGKLSVAVARRDSRHRLDGARRLCHRRLRDVHAAARRDFGGVDAQEVRGRSRGRDGAECRQGLEKGRRDRDPCPNRRDRGGRRSRRPHGANLIPLDGKVVSGEAMVNQRP